MTTRHTIRATYSYEDAEGNVKSEIETRITFDYHRAVRGTLEDPPEPAFVEFVAAEEENHTPLSAIHRLNLSGPRWTPARPDLSDWCETWLENHEDEAIAQATGDADYAREMAADLRRDR